MLVVFLFIFFLIWSCCYALGILLTRYLHRDSFQQSRLFTVVDNNFQLLFKTKTVTKVITKKSNNCHYN